MNPSEGVAELVDADEVDEGTFVREVPDAESEAVRAAVDACPVDAIELLSDDGERILP